MVRTLFGVETEYAVTGFGQSGRASLAASMLEEARVQHRHMNDSAGGVFLANGARFYVDCETHPEYATPECPDPWAAVCQIRAGERIMHQLAQSLPQCYPGLREVLVFRSNLDYQGATWGCHESYLHRADPRSLPRQMVPHFVSRVIYCGAGGFVPYSSKLEFTLSPRAWFLTDGVSGSSTAERPIFHVRNESLSCEPYRRLHVICGESLCSETATLLKLGTTALILASIDAGYRPGDAVTLRSPVEALRQFASDPTCTTGALLSNGQRCSALEIQRHYLEQVERCREQGDLPPWSGALCRIWREHLERLANAPGSVARTLDWAIKLALYRQWANGALRWDTLASWGDTWTAIQGAVDRRPAASPTPGDLDVDALLGEDSPIRDRLPELERKLASRGQSWEGLRRYVRLRRELLEADVRFGQLGPCGVFDQLDQEELIPHHVVQEGEIERARALPPEGTRAWVRGQSIGRHATPSHARCDWQWIRDDSQRILDLSDPFVTEASWQSATAMDGTALQAMLADRARELERRGHVLGEGLRLTEAAAVFGQARQFAESLDDAHAANRARYWHGAMLHLGGRVHEALAVWAPTCERQHRRSLDNWVYKTLSRYLLAKIDLPAPLEMIERGISDLERILSTGGTTRRRSRLLHARAWLCKSRGQYAEATGVAQDALECRRVETGCYSYTSHYRMLVGVCLKAGEPALARRYINEWAGLAECTQTERMLLVAARSVLARYEGDSDAAIEWGRRAALEVGQVEELRCRTETGEAVVRALVCAGAAEQAKEHLARLLALRQCEVGEIRYRVQLLLGDYHLARLRQAVGVPAVDDEFGRQFEATPSAPRHGEVTRRARRAQRSYERVLHIGRELDTLLSCKHREREVRRRLVVVEELMASHAATI